MDIESDFKRALSETEIHRHSRSRLLTVGTTELPYVLLGESMVNLGDTVVRRGIVRIEQPRIVVMGRPHQFEGFDEEETPGLMLALGRVASFPPGKYSNIDTQLDVYEGRLEAALGHYQEKMRDDQLTGLLSGPVDVWACSLMVYVFAMAVQSAPADLRDLVLKSGLPRHWS